MLLREDEAPVGLFVTQVSVEKRAILSNIILFSASLARFWRFVFCKCTLRVTATSGELQAGTAACSSRYSAPPQSKDVHLRD